MAPNKTSDACCRDPLYTAALTFGVIHLVTAFIEIIGGIIALVLADASLGAILLVAGILCVGLSCMLISGVKRKSMAKLVAWNIFAGINLLWALFNRYTWALVPLTLASLVVTVMYNVRVGREQKQGGNRSPLSA